MKQAVPWLIYLDIFKNYFANTQEENFYIIAGSTEASATFAQTGESTFTVQARPGELPQGVGGITEAKRQ